MKVGPCVVVGAKDGVERGLSRGGECEGEEKEGKRRRVVMKGERGIERGSGRQQRRRRETRAGS